MPQIDTYWRQERDRRMQLALAAGRMIRYYEDQLYPVPPAASGAYNHPTMDCIKYLRAATAEVSARMNTNRTPHSTERRNDIAFLDGLE